MKILHSKRHWTVNSSHCRRHYFVIEIWGKMTTFSPKWFHSRTDKRKLWISWGILLIVVPNRNFETLRVLFWMLFKILRRIFKLIILFLLPSWNSNRRFKFSPRNIIHHNIIITYITLILNQLANYFARRTCCIFSQKYRLWQVWFRP